MSDEEFDEEFEDAMVGMIFTPTYKEMLLSAIGRCKDMGEDHNFPINSWDVSNITDMGELFSEWNDFNINIETWDVSNVIYMDGMFRNCIHFNQPLNRWGPRLGNVITMKDMFSGCNEFNQPLDSWDVHNVRNMSGMFIECTNFNQPLNRWNVRNVRNMSQMFNDCTNFNQPLNRWNVSRVNDMSFMFDGCTVFNQPLNRWDVRSVRNMSGIFEDCDNFNQPLDSWDIRDLGYELENEDDMTPANLSTNITFIIPRYRPANANQDLPLPSVQQLTRNINQVMPPPPPPPSANTILNIGKFPDPDDFCPICMQKFNIDPVTETDTNKPDVCVLNTCHHWFHCQCLSGIRNRQCPICRTPIIGSTTGGKKTRKQRKGGKKTRKQRKEGKTQRKRRV